LRLPLEKALVIIRGQKLLQVSKYDYSLHPEAKLLQSCKASTHVPNWRLEQEKSPHPAAAPPPKPAKTAQRKEKAAVQNAPKKGAVTKTDKSSIMD
jgi:type IV secretion system protein VirD4